MTGAHLWAEKYDREVTQIFDIQEELTQRIVVSIAPFIEEAERERVRRQPQDLAHTRLGFERRPRLYKAYRSNDPKMLDEAISDASAALRIDPGSVHLPLARLPSVNGSVCNSRATSTQSPSMAGGNQCCEQSDQADRNDCLGYVQKAMLLAFAPKADRRDEHSPTQDEPSNSIPMTWLRS